MLFMSTECGFMPRPAQMCQSSWTCRPAPSAAADGANGGGDAAAPLPHAQQQPHRPSQSSTHGGMRARDTLAPDMRAPRIFSLQKLVEVASRTDLGLCFLHI